MSKRKDSAKQLQEKGAAKTGGSLHEPLHPERARSPGAALTPGPRRLGFPEASELAARCGRGPAALRFMVPMRARKSMEALVNAMCNEQ